MSVRASTWLLYSVLTYAYRIPGSGSFIRPSSAVSFGTTFLKALISKYVELPHGPGMETVVLGSSRGAISVEAVNLDKIRGNLSQVGKLREVSLDNEQVAAADAPGEIAKTCAGERFFTAFCALGAYLWITAVTRGLVAYFSCSVFMAL